MCAPINKDTFYLIRDEANKLKNLTKKMSYFHQTIENEVHLKKITYKLLFSLIYEHMIDKYEEIIM